MHSFVYLSVNLMLHGFFEIVSEEEGGRKWSRHITLKVLKLSKGNLAQ